MLSIASEAMPIPVSFTENVRRWPPELPSSGVMENSRRLIEGGRWSDRNEPVAPEVLEWMHSLGY